MEIVSKNFDSAEKFSKRQVIPVDYRALDEGMVEEITITPKTKTKRQYRRRRPIDDPDYNPIAPSVKKKAPDSSDGNHSKRYRQPVDYRTLDGGGESEDSSEGNPVTLKRPRPSASSIGGSKKARVEVSLGAPPEGNEVVRDATLKNSSAGSQLPANASQRRLVLVRVPPGASSLTNCRLAAPMPLLRQGQGSAPIAKSSGADGAQRRVVLVPVPPKTAVERSPDPYEIEDALFMKEVNKFLAASMTNELACEPRSSVRPKTSGSTSQKLPEHNVTPADLPEPVGPPPLASAPREGSPRKSQPGPSAARSLICSSEAAPTGNTSKPDPAASCTRLATYEGFDELTDEIVACPMCGSRIRGRQMKRHALVCKGILVKWSDDGYMCDCRAASIDRARQSFQCPRCEAVLRSDDEFQVHVATEHSFFWRLDFENEAAYRRWFLTEGFDETMISGQSKRLPDLEERSFYCAMNSTRRVQAELRCPCRLVVKKRTMGAVSVRYFPAHNHCERVVKRAMTRECRDFVVRLVKMGKSNAAILSEVQSAYPENSRNHHISKELISSIRYKYRQGQTVGGSTRRRGRRPKSDSAEIEEDEMPETIG